MIGLLHISDIRSHVFFSFRRQISQLGLEKCVDQNKCLQVFSIYWYDGPRPYSIARPYTRLQLT